VFKTDGKFTEIPVASNVIKQNHLFLIDLSKVEDIMVAKEDEEKYGENEEDERKSKKQEEEKARKNAEQTEFTKNLAKMFSNQMETMLANVNKQWMEAVDAKFATQTEGMQNE
jgi:hypothetical protein